MIKKNDIIESVANALQYISYYHSPDFIRAMGAAYEKEKSPTAKDALAQILYNSRLCAQGHRPICQDTGIAVVFVEVGMQVQFDTNIALDDIINEGVRQAYLNSENRLRASVLSDPAGKRINTKDNTPAIIHYKMVPGNQVHFKIAAKGGGSENKARFAALNPSADLQQWIIDNVKQMGAGWCPPGILGVGIGGTPEKAMLLAKESLLEPVNIQQLIETGPSNTLEELRLDLYQKINNLGIGAQGLGGLTTVLDVKVKDYPTHAASLPVAIIPNCVATRHIHFNLKGEGPAEFLAPDLNDWPDVMWKPDQQAKHIQLEQVDKKMMASWKPGDRLLLSGKILTARDAAHKKIASLVEKGQALPNDVSFKGRFVYYVGPVDPIEGEAVGPAGPTTSTRMDQYTQMMLEQMGIAGMIGKAERGPNTIELIKQYQSVYLIAVGGAAFLISQAIKKAKVVAFEELGMEAIYEFEIKDMPVTVAVDNSGESIHTTGPETWKVVEFE
jgi:fumarate hydratase, class I